MTAGKYDFLAKEIEKAIQTADRRREKNRSMASRIRLSVIASTAAIPVLLGIQQSALPGTVLANTALALGALATALNAWEAFYGHKELWGVNTAAWSQLVGLRSDLGYLASGADGSVSDEALDRLHARLQGIQSEADAAWIGLRHAGAKLPPPLLPSTTSPDK